MIKKLLSALAGVVKGNKKSIPGKGTPIVACTQEEMSNFLKTLNDFQLGFLKYHFIWLKQEKDWQEEYNKDYNGKN